MPGALTITVAEAASQLGFPKATTERVARDLGLLILAGNRKRIDPNDLPEIMESCRNTPKAPASIAAPTRGCTLSGTPDAGTVQRAQEIAARLKGRSPSISPQKIAAPVVPLARMK